MNDFNPNNNFLPSTRNVPTIAFDAMQGGGNNGGSNNKCSGSQSPDGKPEWRCTQCSKLLGMANGNQLHIRVQKHREYLVGLPVTANCHGCGTLNRKSAS
ncbi:MAG: hypothetical protein WCL10_20190 [Novosphingobium sp.]|uniref:hypothetical protein n=1 Tax=Novosphingobium sp. TaxID=1874826 RepID=UPI00301A8F1C